jgi:hypothetical protein
MRRCDRACGRISPEVAVEQIMDAWSAVPSEAQQSGPIKYLLARPLRWEFQACWVERLLLPTEDKLVQRQHLPARPHL